MLVASRLDIGLLIALSWSACSVASNLLPSSLSKSLSLSLNRKNFVGGEIMGSASN